MKNWTEKQLREAFKTAKTANAPILQNTGIRLSVDEMLWQLARAEKTGMHLTWAESDTVTVKELKDALGRMFPGGKCKRCGAHFHGDDEPWQAVLDNISEHREPEYPPGSMWLDSGKPAVPWYRTGNGTWLKFGREGTFPDDAPVRPLKRMDVI